MFPGIDVDSLQVAIWMVSARAPVLVAHPIIQGVHLLSPVLPHWILIFTVESPAIQSIRVLDISSLSFFELSLQRQVFSLI